MENVNIDKSELDVTSLSDAELAQELRRLGANIGPITDSTRAVYQRKLQRWLKSPPSHAEGIAESNSSHTSLDESLETSQPNNYSTEQPLQEDGNNMLDQSSRNLPAVSQEDIDLVDRVMTTGLHSTPYKLTAYQHFQNNDFTRAEPSNEETSFRNRSSVQAVTPRPPIHGHSKDFGMKTSSGSATRLSSKLPAVSDSNRANKGHTAIYWILFIGILAVLIAVGVVLNMEPAYSSPFIR